MLYFEAGFKEKTSKRLCTAVDCSNRPGNKQCLLLYQVLGSLVGLIPIDLQCLSLPRSASEFSNMFSLCPLSIVKQSLTRPMWKMELYTSSFRWPWSARATSHLCYLKASLIFQTRRYRYSNLLYYNIKIHMNSIGNYIMPGTHQVCRCRGNIQRNNSPSNKWSALQSSSLMLSLKYLFLLFPETTRYSIKMDLYSSDSNIF